MADQQYSELLRVLEQLDGAAWAEALLPLLRADKSAGTFALACKQLRQLCQGNQRHLKLTGANCQHLKPLELDAFSRRFPACSSVAFTASSTDDELIPMLIAMPLLARLPNLQSLQLNVDSSDADEPIALVAALQLMRLQLPQLRSLQLRRCSGYATNRPDCWELLGAVTQLSKLQIAFHDDPYNSTGLNLERDLNLEHLWALQPLGSNLQHLELTAEHVDHDKPQDCGFLSSFTGLTSLVLPLIDERSDLAAITSCKALQQLELAAHEDLALGAAECAALAQLTRLTKLDIPPSSDTPALLSALQCLSGLQALRLQDMSSSHLPALAALTKLTFLRGSWADEPTEDSAAAAGGAPVTCLSIAKLWMTGAFPLAAFPGAKELLISDTWQPSQLASLSQRMKKLESLGINDGATESTFRSLDASAPEAERVAAVRSLGQLAQLTELQFAMNDDAEAAALATACRRVSKVWLCVPRRSSVTALGLASGLCRLSTLRVLTLVLYGLQLSQSEARLLLTGWSGLCELYVSTEMREQQQVWEAAAAATRAAALPLPADCYFDVI